MSNSTILKVIFNNNNVLGLEYLKDINSKDDNYFTISMPFNNLNLRVTFYIDLEEIDETKIDLESDEFLKEIRNLFKSYFIIVNNSRNNLLL